jgi:nucleotide sugar dehydrogenase
VKVGIIGLGYVGLTLAAELANRGNLVLAYDTDKLKISEITEGVVSISEPGLEYLVKSSIGSKLLIPVTDIEVLNDVDLFVICVGTPMHNNEADLNGVTTAIREVARIRKTTALITIKSTVPPGTTSKLANELLKDYLDYVGFIPERLAEGQALIDIRQIPLVVGGVTSAGGKILGNVWEKLGFQIVPVPHSTVAELIKLADNLWIDLNIALGMELAMLCDVLEIDVLDVVKGANSLPKGNGKVNILTPSVGVGGSCLKKDPWFLADFAKNLGVNVRLPALARKINDNSPLYLFDRLEDIVTLEDKKNVLVVGLAFKNNSGDLRNSPAVEFCSLLEKHGYEYRWFDPLVSEREISSDLAARRIVSLPSDQKFSIVANLAAHDKDCRLEVEKIAQLLRSNGVFVDGRRFLAQVDIINLRNKKIRYLGVGRG